MHFIIFLILIFSIPIIVSLLISKLIYNYIKEKVSNKYYKLLALIPILIVGYFYLESFYPSDSYYENKFEEITNIELPSDSIVRYKDSDFLGEDINFTIEIPPTFHKTLQNKLLEKGFKESITPSTSGSIKLEKQLKDNKITNQLSIENYGMNIFYTIKFLNDNKTIVVGVFDSLT